MFSIDIHKLLNQFRYNPEEPLIFNSGLFLFLFLGFLIIYILLSKTHRPKLHLRYTLFVVFLLQIQWHFTFCY
jgi:alginate O-acetyltransferase complex protein AlgI